eukprot:TRINITY_DN106046_c0_g1_i1.p1 TRINITY_DN106046_c0_g1~~TRINITY_DN106046_c0_g1_i1.p1  ORF type:complete len:293 (-),score=40.49 TRINITY_DN106046_c0_g1_i1:139-1017(-)
MSWWCCRSSNQPPPGATMSGYDSASGQGNYGGYGTDQESLLAANSKASAGSSSGFSCCCRACCCFFAVLLFFLLWVTILLSTNNCAIESFDHRQILPANAAGDAQPLFDRGTAGNMNLTSLDIDLQGIWWMDGNPLSAEHLVSFASAGGQPPFPAKVPVYNNMQRRWTWTDSFMGRVIMAYYAFDAQPDSPLVFDFTNSTDATIEPIGGVFDDTGLFRFHKISDNEWDRPDAGYVLRRIVNGDGSQGLFWEKFAQWYNDVQPSGNMLVWSSDKGCLRKRQYFLPCPLCKSIC